MNLYIDTNIYLGYFGESSDHLTPLRELEGLLAGKKVKKLVLLLPEQTSQEYFRNKGNIIELTRKRLVEQSKLFSLPALIDREREESKKVLDKIRALQDALKEFIKKYDEEVESEQTDADKFIKKLFAKSKVIKEGKDLLEKAHIRYLKGNPPRKSDYSYGDAIIWESLLSSAAGDDLTIVSRDSDFIGRRKGEKVLHPFLEKEWKERSRKKIKFFTSLAEFIKSFDKDSKIKTETIKKEKEKPLTATGLLSTVTVANEAYNPDYLLNTFIFDVKTAPTKPVEFCPYCGARINTETNPLHDVGIAEWYKEGLLLSRGSDSLSPSNEYTCANCGKRFKLS